MHKPMSSEKMPEIRGNTLRTYLHVLKHGPCELRDVQRGLELSSPSLASYHLNRLIRSEYVRRDETGRYVATKDATSDLLTGYWKMGATIVPQSLFFAFLFTILVVFFGLVALFSADYVVYLFAVSIGCIGIMWYQTARLWRKLVTWS